MKAVRFFSRLKIRVKLLAAFGSLLLLSALLIVYSFSSINTILSYKSLNESLDQLQLRMEAMELAATEFIYEGYKSDEFLLSKQSTTIDKFYQSWEAIQITLRDLQQSPHSSINVFALTDRLSNIRIQFDELTELLHRRGFKDHGLEGMLRNAIHTVENSSANYDKATMLMLRRHEKDFFLRKDNRYKDEFDKQHALLVQAVQQFSTSHQIIDPLREYQRLFHEVVALENKIGLKEGEGIRGSIRTAFSDIRPQIEQTLTTAKEDNEEQIADTRAWLITIFVMQFITGLVMAIIYANLLTNAIKEIRTAMQKLAQGFFPEKLQIKSTEEIGQTKIAFNQFVDRLQTATVFAEQLGRGEYNGTYDEMFKDDVLARSIISLQTKLREAEERQRRINWTNEGAAKFNELIKQEFKDIESLADAVLLMLVRYLKANQGALYVLEHVDKDTALRRIGTYAYGKKKFSDDRMDAGYGLAGQCAHEGEIIYLKDVPPGYVKITSGLGEATPRNILIVPLRQRNSILGVLELASFTVFESYQISFVEKMAEGIASFMVMQQLRGSLDTHVSSDSMKQEPVLW